MPGVRIPSLRPRRGDEIDVTPIFFSIHAGFRAFQGRFFKIAPPWMSNPQKSKNSKNRLLVTVNCTLFVRQYNILNNKWGAVQLLRKAVFSFFRHRQRNDFRLSVRAVLEFDRGRRRWGLTGSRDGRND